MSEDSDCAKTKLSSVHPLWQLWRRINDYKIAQWAVAYVALVYNSQDVVQLTSEAFKWEGVPTRSDDFVCN